EHFRTRHPSAPYSPATCSADNWVSRALKKFEPSGITVTAAPSCGRTLKLTGRGGSGSYTSRKASLPPRSGAASGSARPGGLSLFIQYRPLVADEDVSLLAVGGDGGAEDRLRDRFLDEMSRAISQNEVDPVLKAQFGQRFLGVVDEVRR